MKLKPGRISLVILAAALTVALWRLWENERELAVLRDETENLKTAQKTHPVESGKQPPAVPANHQALPPAVKYPPRDDYAPAEFARLPEEERTAFLKHWREQMEAKRAIENAAKALTEQNKGPQAASYAGGKATGPPDGDEHGRDSPNAWCPAPMSSGGEWLKLSYGKPVEISEIAIHESYATGALSRVVALMPDGKERVLWEGKEPVEPPPVQRIVPVPPGVRSDQIRIELDTTRTNTWQEIDAVELVGHDGSRQWAKEAESSSYWGSGR